MAREGRMRHANDDSRALLRCRGGPAAGLPGLEVEVAPGELVVLQGPEPCCGRVTDLVLGHARAAGDAVTVCGLDPGRRPVEVLRRVGYVPPEPDAWGTMRPSALFAVVGPHYPTWDEDLAEELVQDWGVPDMRLDRMAPPAAERVMWCAALAFRPRLLLLGEPFGVAGVRAGAEVFARASQIVFEGGGGVLALTAGQVPGAVRARVVTAGGAHPCP